MVHEGDRSDLDWGGPYSLVQRVYYAYLLCTYGLVIGVSLALSFIYSAIPLLITLGIQSENHKTRIAKQNAPDDE